MTASWRLNMQWVPELRKSQYFFGVTRKLFPSVPRKNILSLLLNRMHSTLEGDITYISWSCFLYEHSFRLSKTMATHSNTLAWKIPWTEEPGRLQSMGLLRVRHDWATSLSLFTFMHWRRKWQPTPVFLPGESQGRGSLVGCRLWGRTESDTTEET